MIGLRILGLAALLGFASVQAGAQENESPAEPGAAIPPPVVTPTAPRPTAGTQPERPDNRRFGKVLDAAYGAYQRGLYLTARNLALPRAEAGDAAAQTLLAEIYANGLGVRRDPREAARWYQLAAEQGDPAAQFQYALMLMDGEFVPPDPEAALALMEDSANAGNAMAQFNYAQMLLVGETDEADIARAVEFFERAAETGLPDALFAMAEIYTVGLGGREADEALARDFLQRAALLNYDTAQLELGTWLVQGRGGPADAETGYAWLLRAAEGGNIAARNRVARLLREGIGTEADPVAAAAWYMSARGAGLVDPEMDEFLEGLSEEQRAQATERSRTL